MLAFPAQSMCSTMPPGAAAPYFKRQSLLVQIGIDTSWSSAGCVPPAKKILIQNTRRSKLLSLSRSANITYPLSSFPILWQSQRDLSRRDPPTGDKRVGCSLWKARVDPESIWRCHCTEIINNQNWVIKIVRCRKWSSDFLVWLWFCLVTAS